jgi:hypothetical protein
MDEEEKAKHFTSREKQWRTLLLGGAVLLTLGVILGIILVWMRIVKNHYAYFGNIIDINNVQEPYCGRDPCKFESPNHAAVATKMAFGLWALWKTEYTGLKNQAGARLSTNGAQSHGAFVQESSLKQKCCEQQR